MGCTGRAPVALAQIDDPESRPAGMPDGQLKLLRTSMEAIDAGRPATVQASVDGWMAAAMAGPGATISAIMVLSALVASTRPSPWPMAICCGAVPA